MEENASSSKQKMRRDHQAAAEVEHAECHLLLSGLRLPRLFELCVLCGFLQIEDIVTLIQDETEGVPIRTVKSFMTKIPSVVTGKTLSPLRAQALWLMMVEMLFRQSDVCEGAEKSHMSQVLGVVVVGGVGAICLLGVLSLWC